MTPSLSTSTPVLSTEGLKKHFVLPLTAGGALWIGHYALQLAMGWKGEQIHRGTPLSSLDGLCFAGTIIGFCAGLFALTNQSPNRRGFLSLVGQVFAFGAALCATSSFLAGKSPGFWDGMGVIGSCLSATFVALAASKARAIPASLAKFLLLIGLLTFPLIMALGWPADKWTPAFYTDDLPFALAGIAYITFARLLSKSHP